METTELARRVEADTDDVLATLPLVRENDQLVARLFDQLVDLLLEGILLDLRRDLVDGRLTAAQYAVELSRLATQARAAGLLDNRS